MITDEEANEIYMRISRQVAGKNAFVKKNWTEAETNLLKWAVMTYTKQRNITHTSLVSTPSLVKAIQGKESTLLTLVSTLSTLLIRI
jgi:hypothetical protein